MSVEMKKIVAGSLVQSLINKEMYAVGENGTLLNEDEEVVDGLLINDATKASYKLIRNPETIAEGFGIVGGKLVHGGEEIFSGTRTFVDGFCIAVPGMFVYVLANNPDGGFDILSYDAVQEQFAMCGHVPVMPEKAGENPDGFEVWVYTQTHEEADPDDDKAEPKIIFDTAGYIIFVGFGKVHINTVNQPLSADAMTDGFRLYIATDSYVPGDVCWDEDDEYDDEYDDDDHDYGCGGEVKKGVYSYLVFGRHGGYHGRVETAEKAVSVTRNNILRGSLFKTSKGYYFLDENGRQAIEPGADIMAKLDGFNHIVAADEEGYIFAKVNGESVRLFVKKDDVLGTTYSL